MAKPAKMDIKIFIETIVNADLDKSSFLDRYELYVTMTETPTLIEKKDCPKANRIVFELRFEKSGYKKKEIPSPILSNVSERMIKMIKAMNRAGIITLLARSIPFCTPFATTIIVMTMKI